MSKILKKTIVGLLLLFLFAFAFASVGIFSVYAQTYECKLDTGDFMGDVRCVPAADNCGEGFFAGNCSEEGVEGNDCENNNPYSCIPNDPEDDEDTGSVISPEDDDDGSVTSPSQTFSIDNPLRFGSVEEALRAIAGFLFNVGISIAVVFIIIGGFQFATAAGNPEKINTGKRTITWAIIGIVVLLVAGSIATLIDNILG